MMARISGVIGLCPAGYVQEKKDVVFQRLKDPVFYELGIICRRDKQFTPAEEGFLELTQPRKDKDLIL